MRKKILFVLLVLFGLMMINSGLNKLFHYMPMPQPDEMSESMMTAFFAFIAIGWLMPLIAIIEIVAGVLIVIPKTRALGAIMILPVMVGIVLTHLVNDPGNTTVVVIALVLFAINIWTICENCSKYKALIG